MRLGLPYGSTLLNLAVFRSVETFVEPELTEQLDKWVKGNVGPKFSNGCRFATILPPKPKDLRVLSCTACLTDTLNFISLVSEMLSRSESESPGERGIGQDCNTALQPYFSPNTKTCLS